MQLRPQGFSLKKWVGREKPWGRGCNWCLLKGDIAKFIQIWSTLTSSEEFVEDLSQLLISQYNIVDATYVACIDLCGKLVHSVMSVSRVFFLGKSQPPRAFPLLEDSEFFLMLSLLVILRSCISTLKVLNCDLEDHLKKVYDCVLFVQTIPVVWPTFAQSRCPWSRDTQREYRSKPLKHSIVKGILVLKR